MEKFNLSALTDEQCENFVALLNSKLFDHLGFYKNARFANLKQNEDSTVYLVLNVDGWREREHYYTPKQIEVNMVLLLNELDCLKVSTNPNLDIRNGMLKKHITKLWREFLSAEYKDEYAPLLEQCNQSNQATLAQ